MNLQQPTGNVDEGGIGADGGDENQQENNEDDDKCSVDKFISEASECSVECGYGTQKNVSKSPDGCPEQIIETIVDCNMHSCHIQSSFCIRLIIV